MTSWSLPQPFTIVYLALAVALINLWRRRAETRRRLLLFTVPFLLLTFLCTPLVAYLAIGSLEWLYPPHGKVPGGSTTLVVLGGYINRPDGARESAEIGHDTLYRCLHAARLYHQTQPRTVLVSGGKTLASEAGPSIAEVMRDFLITQGVPESAILVEGRSANTFENAVETARMLKQRRVDRVILVTNATHMLRAVRCFRKQGIEVIPSGCEYITPGFGRSIFDFLPSSAAAGDFQIALHEWLGLAFYWVVGRV